MKEYNITDSFTSIARENLKYYVYCLIDPRNDEVFYIGKGQNNRVFSHLSGKEETEKSKQIAEIKKSGKEVRAYVVRHGMETEDEAFHVEATLIAFLQSNSWKKRSLKNIVCGHHEMDYGMKTTEEVNLFYVVDEIKKKDIKNNALIIKINKSYKKENGNVYEATRKSWVLSEKKLKDIEIVISEYNGVFRKVFKPTKWYKDPLPEKGNRWMFDGIDVSDSPEFSKYINKRYTGYQKGAQNPIKYVFPNKSKKA